MTYTIGRAIAGLLLSSLAFGVVYALTQFGMLVFQAADGALPTFLPGAFATSTFLATFFAVTVLILIGRPLYLITRDHPQWYIAVIAGLAVAFGMDFALTFAFAAAAPEGGGLVAQLPHLLISSARVGLLGGIAGWVYWLVARPGHTA